MSSFLRNFALAWNLGFRIFLDLSTSPRLLLDWDHHNADGTHLALGYGVESFRTPRRFFHERSDTVSLEPYSGPAPGSRGIVGPEPDYPQEWSLDTIAHQHFLACAWLGFWCVKERGLARWPIRICWLRRSAAAAPPQVFDKFLDQMVLAFENLMAEYCQARDDHVEEDALCKQLFELVLNMEHALFWMSRLGFWVAWSIHYNQLLEQLFPAVLSNFPSTQRQAEFNRLRARLFFSCNPSSPLPEGVQSGINPLDAPTGIACLRLIPWEDSSSDVWSRPWFKPDPASDVSSAHEATMRFSFSGVLEYLHELASTDGPRIPVEEFAPPGHFLVGEELDLEIAAAGLLPSDFVGATLPLRSTAGEATPTSSDIPPRTHKRPCRRTPTEPGADREANRTRCPSQPRPEPPVTAPVPPTRSSFVATQDPSQPVCSFPLEGFRPQGAVGRVPSNRYTPIPARWIQCKLVSLTPIGSSSAICARHNARSTPLRRCAAEAAARNSDPVVIISSDSEDDAPPSKRRKASPPREESSPEVIVVTDEEAMSVQIGDFRYPEGADEDVSMPSLDPPIVAVPPEQHASSSRSTLDDLLSNAPDPHFLGFCLRPMEDLSPSSQTAFVDEIVHWTDQSGADEERVESTLLFISAIFSQAGNTLGHRRRDRKGKGRDVS
ncbi:hypothetical protein B0H14DRAFT_3530850 [Mycena olivaceomarginata]|nr:hypothetical protein B0H14DRAFT_3530850 [Mycena olivaceomarginata]